MNGRATSCHHQCRLLHLLPVHRHPASPHICPTHTTAMMPTKMSAKTAVSPSVSNHSLFTSRSRSRSSPLLLPIAVVVSFCSPVLQPPSSFSSSPPLQTHRRRVVVAPPFVSCSLPPNISRDHRQQQRRSTYWTHGKSSSWPREMPLPSSATPRVCNGPTTGSGLSCRCRRRRQRSRRRQKHANSLLCTLYNLYRGGQRETSIFTWEILKINAARLTQMHNRVCERLSARMLLFALLSFLNKTPKRAMPLGHRFIVATRYLSSTKTFSQGFYHTLRNEKDHVVSALQKVVVTRNIVRASMAFKRQLRHSPSA